MGWLHPEQPPPEQLQPCRLPVPSHPSCPCAAVRAGGLPAASSAGQPLARGVRADLRRRHQRAGWQQGGMGWAHTQLFGQGEGLLVVSFGLFNLWRLAPRRNVAKEPQGIRLVATFLALTGGAPAHPRRGSVPPQGCPSASVPPLDLLYGST
jgi:hypothetical protein